jgi:hypothetical protein
MDAKKVIMYESPEAASIKTITGWVSSIGHFWGDNEHMARYDGSTHKLCETCGAVVEQRSYCQPCSTRKEIEKFAAMPREPWDGESPIYSELLDKYFFNGEVFDYLEDENGFEDEEGNVVAPYTEADLRLVHCDPRHLHCIESDTWEDDLPSEDGGEFIPAEVQTALDALNEAIKKAGPVSWWAKAVAVQLPLKLEAKSE